MPVPTKRIITRNVLSSGGKIHQVSYQTTGAGLQQVKFQKDVMGRFHVLPVRRAVPTSGGESRRRRVNVAQSIGQGLRGRGVTLV